MRSPSFPAHHCRKSTSPGSVKSAGPACSHCQGHLVADLYIDKIDAGGHVWIRTRRCVRCGIIEETGRMGYESQGLAGNNGHARQRTTRKVFDDEIIVLGT